jgi:hypothetical protein
MDCSAPLGRACPPSCVCCNGTIPDTSTVHGAVAAGWVDPSGRVAAVAPKPTVVARNRGDGRARAALSRHGAASCWRTLAVRLGRPRVVRLYAAVVVIAYAALPVLMAAGLPLAVALATALLAPLAAWRIWCVRDGWALRPESWEGFTFWAAALLVLTAAAEIVGFLLL